MSCCQDYPSSTSFVLYHQDQTTHLRPDQSTVYVHHSKENKFSLRQIIHLHQLYMWQSMQSCCLYSLSKVCCFLTVSFHQCSSSQFFPVHLSIQAVPLQSPNNKIAIECQRFLNCYTVPHKGDRPALRRRGRTQPQQCYQIDSCRNTISDVLNSKIV